MSTAAKNPRPIYEYLVPLLEIAALAYIPLVFSVILFRSKNSSEPIIVIWFTLMFVAAIIHYINVVIGTITVWNNFTHRWEHISPVSVFNVLSLAFIMFAKITGAIAYYCVYGVFIVNFNTLTLGCVIVGVPSFVCGYLMYSYYTMWKMDHE